MYIDLLNVINENRILYRGGMNKELGKKYLFYTDPIEDNKDHEEVMEKLNQIYLQIEEGRIESNKDRQKLDSIGNIKEKEKYILDRVEKLETMLEENQKKNDVQEQLLREVLDQLKG
mmetsp:Transcript_21729/g.20834  ORF Transcript_21729/g.20834 Transcript_21729/m.20834 type:complete len:117 (-) Transcript_21729:29-379(-)